MDVVMNELVSRRNDVVTRRERNGVVTICAHFLAPLSLEVLSEREKEN
jgi:hypothetical protein